jgi:hypothetical protein
MGLRRRVGEDSPYHPCEAPAVAEPFLQPAQVLVRDSWHLAGSDAGVFRPERWQRRPRRETCAPAPAPDSNAQRRPLGNPTARWAARSWVAPASASLDGDDDAPGRGRLRPASGGVDHRPCSRPPRLSTTGTAGGGGEGGATLGGGGGGGGRMGRGGERCDAVPPCALVVVGQFLQRAHRSFIRNDGQQTNNNQKLTKGGFQQGGLNVVPLPTPSKRHNLPLGLGGGGGRIRFGADRKGWGCDYHEVNKKIMTTMTMARGESKGTSINDSIS